jgi:hypothetical protein
MSDIFREVDEALKQDKALDFWKENGPFIIGCAVIVILTTAAVNGYRAWDQYHDKADTGEILLALEGQSEAPAKLEAISGEVRPGHRGIALLMAAGGHLEEGNTSEALRLYAQAAADKSIPDDLRGYAILMQARLYIDGENLEEKKSAEEILAMLKPLTGDPSGAWHWHALLQQALVYAHMNEDYEAAATSAGKVAASTEAPATLRSRAAALESVYSVRLKTQK